MKSLFIAIALTLLAIAQVHAQEPTSVSESCERGWLASDWPTVAVDCSTLAATEESLSERHKAQAIQSSRFFKEAVSLIGPELYVAAAAHARAAVAYAHLHKESFFSLARAASIDDLRVAQQFLSMYGPEDVAQRTPTLKSLVQSEGFVKAAPDSDLLAHI
jgi:hypothetical protein